MLSKKACWKLLEDLIRERDEIDVRLTLSGEERYEIELIEICSAINTLAKVLED